MESHSAPPGYNPNVSLLQGGTAPITPVQGGGGMGTPPTPEYNASVSLLEGGTGTIQAVRGGGPDDKVKFAPGEALKKVKVFEKEEEKQQNKRGVADFYSIEKYVLTDSSDAIPTLETNKKKRRDLYNEVALKEGIASLYKLTDGGPRLIPVKRGSYDVCKKPRTLTFLSSIERRVRVSDTKDPFIILAVNIKGDLKKFLKVKELFIKENTPYRKPDVFLFFMGSFFSSNVSESNQVLYDEFMHLKQTYGPKKDFPCQVYGLFEINESLLNNACDITESLYETKQSASGKTLNTFMEPDIFVFPKRKLVLRTCPLPVSKDKMSLHTYIKDTQTSKPATFLLEQGTEEFAPQFKYFDISFDSTKKQTKFPAESEIKCKDAVCPEFQEGFPLKTFIGGTYKSHLNLVEPGLYLIYNNVNKYKLPLLHEEVESTNEVQPAQPNEEEEEVKVVTEEGVVVPPSPGPPAPPVKPTPQIERIEEPEKVPGAFKASPEAYKSETSTDFQIEYEGFSIRNPTKDNQVKEDWLQGTFTEGEVSLLNGLKLSPEVLEDLFKDKWKQELASFLESLTNSSCFKDTQYLLTSECDQARRFLRKVYYKIYVDTLNKLYARWGIQGPAPDSTEILEALLKEIGQFMIMFGKDREGMSTAETKNIAAEEFLGDPAGRYLKIMVDLENEDKPFFANYADLDNASKGKLANLETQIDTIRKGIKSYKRITGKNLKSILNAYKKTRKATKPSTKESVNASTETTTNEGTQTVNVNLANKEKEIVTKENAGIQTNNATALLKLEEEEVNINNNISRASNLREKLLANEEQNLARTTGSPGNVNRNSNAWKKNFTMAKSSGLEEAEAKEFADDEARKRSPTNTVTPKEKNKIFVNAEPNADLVNNTNTNTLIAKSETTPLIKKNNKNTKKKGLLSSIQEKIKKGTRKLRFPKRGYANLTNNNSSNSVPGLKNTTKKNEEIRRKAEAKVEAQRLANLKVLAKRQAKNENTRRKKEKAEVNKEAKVEVQRLKNLKLFEERQAKNENTRRKAEEKVEAQRLKNLKLFEEREAKVEAQRLKNLKLFAKRQAKEQNQSKKKVKQNTKYKTLKNKNKPVNKGETTVEE